MFGTLRSNRIGSVAAVLDHDAQLASVNATGLVDLIHAHAQAVGGLLAEAGDRPGQVLDTAEDDFVLGDTLLRLGERRGHQARQRHGSENA